MLHGPQPGLPDVLEVRPDFAQPCLLPATLDILIACGQKGQVVGAVRLAHGREEFRLAQLFLAILPQQLVHPVTVGGQGVYERLAGQPAQAAQVRAGHRRRGLEGKAAAKHGQAHEDLLFFFSQTFPRVVESCPHAALAFGHIALFRFQNVDAALHFGGNACQREHIQPAGGQHQRQRHTFRQPADLCQVADVSGRKCKVRPCPACALDEEPGRIVGRQLFQGLRGRKVQPAEDIDRLAVEIEFLTRGGQHLDGRRGLEQVGYQGSAGQQMLEIVEHQQRPAITEVVQ